MAMHACCLTIIMIIILFYIIQITDSRYINKVWSNSLDDGRRMYLTTTTTMYYVILNRTVNEDFSRHQKPMVYNINNIL